MNMTKKNILTVVAVLVLSPLIISSLIHYFQNRAKTNGGITVVVPSKPYETAG